MKPLRNLNFALSNRCNAKCVWCPTSRGTKLAFDMDAELVYKIIDEVSHPDFPYEIKNIHMSENGEGLYHKSYVDILRYIKKNLPNTEIDMLSNFGLMSKRMSRVLLEENLLTSIQVNVDGHNDRAYRSVKGISFSSVMKNVKEFLEIKKELGVEMFFGINVMPAFEYSLAVFTTFDKNPIQHPPGESVPFSSFELTQQSVLDYLGQDLYDELFTFRHSKPGLWAERERFKTGEFTIDNDLTCPLIKRVEEEMFIAPNGDYYVCCLDDNNDKVLGNLKESTVLEIWESQDRINFVNNLKMQRFDKIGYPCNTVGACQTLGITDNALQRMSDTYKDGDEIVLEETSVVK